MVLEGKRGGPLRGGSLCSVRRDFYPHLSRITSRLCRFGLLTPSSPRSPMSAGTGVARKICAMLAGFLGAWQPSSSSSGDSGDKHRASGLLQVWGQRVSRSLAAIAPVLTAPPSSAHASVDASGKGLRPNSPPEEVASSTTGYDRGLTGCTCLPSHPAMGVPLPRLEHSGLSPSLLRPAPSKGLTPGVPGAAIIAL